ncbi:VOC family protein [Bacillus sp. FJAT-42376]|uniref:VOC family protein n=1 Tax=Bacillus sp. FJAT-42376 TaxID=2014076 RepID=UPI000F4D9E6E|nr:VOC family protein [Bacillus sp. FJAT-42376]AZB41873.1 VOC family protein [Bacillus sp. FJAT-42376]
MKNLELFETHVYTLHLMNSIEFYRKLELEVAYIIKERGVAFFWIGDPAKKKQMLGVWEVPKVKFRKSHFAFHVNLEELLNAPTFLSKQGIELSPDFGLDTSEPIVHSWMPSASYYFEDPDGNSLEYISALEGEPIPELGAVHLSTWREIQKKAGYNC